MFALVVWLQNVLASRVEESSPKVLAALQSVPTGFTPAPTGFMIVTSASVPGGGMGLRDGVGLAWLVLGEGGGVGESLWCVVPPLDRLVATTTATTTTAAMPPPTSHPRLLPRGLTGPPGPPGMIGPIGPAAPYPPGCWMPHPPG